MAPDDSMKTDKSLSLPASNDLDETRIEQGVVTLGVLSNVSSTIPAPKAFNKPQSEEEVAAVEVLNHAALENGEEDLEDAMNAAQTSQYPSLAQNLLQDEKAKGILERRTMQATIHMAFTELRIRDLEEQLRKVKIDLYKLPDDFQVPKLDEKGHPTFQHVLQRSTPDQFKSSKDLINIPSKDRPALEALVIEQLKDLETYSKLSAPRGLGTGFSKGTPSTHQVPESLRIRPRPLIAHLQRVTRTHISNDLAPPLENENQKNIVFLRPFKLLVMYEEEIRESLRILEKEDDELSTQQESEVQIENNEKTYNGKDLLLDLRLLVKFLDEDLRPTLELRQKIKDGTATDLEYQDLWHLFNYGDIVLVQSDKSHAYRALNFTGGREPLIDRMEKGQERQTALDGFVVDCISMKCDGSNYLPQLEVFTIRPFFGRQPITSLPLYPLKFDENSDGLKRNLIAQGRRYLDVTIPPQSHKHLRGRTLDEPPHDIDSQVIIDMTMAVNNVPEWRPQTRGINKDQFTKGDPRETQFPASCLHRRYTEGCCGGDVAFKDLEIDHLALNNFIQSNQHTLGPRTHTKLEEEDLMLLPRHVHGFILRSRQWISLCVDDLSEVRFESGFDELMLPERHKSTIQALVNVHENAVTSTGKVSPTIGSSIDLVKGKGAGLILLLHGEPGVGKTLTAECVADNTKRPLFPITCGDIGETATEVEKNLHYNFRLAHKWGCVLLLDEADVFLAKRNKTDLRRNAVTSVFLRSLEYYAGILFLTTNRVGNIDPAFKSRLHMSLFYPKFDLEATTRLYSTYIKRTRTEQERAKRATFKIKEKEILKFAKRHFRRAEKEGLGTWNGRQIRNAFQAAIALVEYESQQTKEGDPRPTLGEPQFNTVAESSREFDRYLVSTLGAADSDIARREEWRFDRFGNLESKQSALPQSYDRKKPGFYSGKDRDSDDDTSSDDDDDDDSNDSSSNDNGFTKKHSGKQAQAAEKNEDDDKEAQEYKEFQEYLKQKRARKSGRRHDL
ncbi:hypothetical protein HD806DRAFT_514024 [Xylariaceae sp. AK1471]|nr:hypothetical protein HD806DRAFT_514024 [Xylariaceae sp. AK1471]